jgi:hypothetical protein
MKSASNNLALFLYYILLVLGEAAESLLDGLGAWVQVEFMLNQLPRDSWHVNRLPYEDVPILLEEFDERQFLFGIQGVTYVSNLGRFLRRQQDLFAECVLRLDGLLGILGIGHDRV